MNTIDDMFIKDLLPKGAMAQYDIDSGYYYTIKGDCVRYKSVPSFVGGEIITCPIHMYPISSVTLQKGFLYIVEHSDYSTILKFKPSQFISGNEKFIKWAKHNKIKSYFLPTIENDILIVPHNSNFGVIGKTADNANHYFYCYVQHKIIYTPGLENKIMLDILGSYNDER